MVESKLLVLGANMPGKPLIFMPYAAGLPVYTEECDAVAAAGYRGFNLTSVPH